MTGLIIGAVAVVIAGVIIGIWTNTGKQRHTGKRQRGKAAGTAAGVGIVCAACGHQHTIEETRRSLYYGQRSIGDLHALQRGRLPQRILRRKVSRALMRGLWGS